uniref:Recombinase domain-containing protein n=1 Tax=Steinernema glaseri TaxID=37863 RepID=A0A1I8AEG3_9BILA
MQANERNNLLLTIRAGEATAPAGMPSKEKTNPETPRGKRCLGNYIWTLGPAYLKRLNLRPNMAADVNTEQESKIETKIS